MLPDSFSSTMPLSPSAMSVSQPQTVADSANSTNTVAIRPAMLLSAGLHAVELFENDCSSKGSPAIASLALPSLSPTLSPIALALEASKTKPSTTTTSVPVSANATHQKGQTGMNGGRWTEQEHQSFLAGLRLYGREWKKVAAKIKTRTSAQIRSHAQKYFAKLARDDEMRKHGGLLLTAPVAPSLAGYFSDGGSSVAQYSGDDDADATDAVWPVGSSRTSAMDRTDTHSEMLFSQMGSAINGLYKPAFAANKKRARSMVTGFDAPLGLASSICGASSSSASSGYPYKIQKRSPPSKDAAPVERLPSQEELLAKASPNVRHRLSSLIEAELCALQVLSCYAQLQQQSHGTALSHKMKQKKGRPRKLPAAVSTATGSGSKASALGLSILSTEQIPSTSSIY